MTLPMTAMGFGFTLIGGDKKGEPIRIGHIEKGGVAEKDGRLMVGDALVKVNKISLQTYSHQDVVELFKKLKLGSDVSIEVSRGYDPESLSVFQMSKLAIILNAYSG